MIAEYLMPEVHIINADTFDYQFTRKFDLIVGNLPWGMKIDYSGRRVSIEEAFHHPASTYQSQPNDH